MTEEQVRETLEILHDLFPVCGSCSIGTIVPEDVVDMQFRVERMTPVLREMLSSLSRKIRPED